MAARTTGLSTHIWNNNIKCIVLLCLYPLLLAGIFWAIGLFLGIGSAPHAYHTSSPDFSTLSSFATNLTIEFFPLILTVVSIWFIIAWFFHTAMIRNLSHSHPVTRMEEPEIYNLLENLCIAQGMKTPRLEIIETEARNAFASGINQNSYTITLTRGLINSLNSDELEGVLAHELTHIINHDVRLLIVTVIFTGLFGFLAQMAWSNLRYSLFFNHSRHRRDNNNHIGGLVLMVGIAVLLWLGYLATLLMRFSLSRSREYMADAGAVAMTKNPEAMIRALQNISGHDRLPQTTEDIAMMCIENHTPFMGLFATHPPIQKRIHAIGEITNTPIPDSSHFTDTPLSQPATRSKRKRNPWQT